MLQQSGNSWYATWHLSGIGNVLISKELYQHRLFVWNSAGEETERHPSIAQEANRVDQEDLRGHTPQEPAHISGMAAPSIHLGSDVRPRKSSRSARDA